ncbi:MAG: DNA-3-methyladenine glycosylase family protein [Thermomicrobiales bacterium]
MATDGNAGFPTDDEGWENLSHRGSLPILRQATLTPPAPYALDLTAVALARFPRLLNRWNSTTYRRLFAVDGVFVAVAVRQGGPPTDPRLLLTFTGPTQVVPALLDRLTGYVVRMLGAADAITPFLAVAAHDPVIGPLTRALPGLRLFRKSDVVEEVIVNILAQQISLPFAYQCKARLIAAYGPRLTVGGTTRYALPTPAILATIAPEAVRPLLISRQKAAALRAFGAAVTSGALDLAALSHLGDADAIAALTSVRGIGPWTAHWTLGRTLGRGHIVPVGDVGVQAMLGRAYGLGRKMTPDEVRHWADGWGEHALLAAAYLIAGTWRGLVS